MYFSHYQYFTDLFHKLVPRYQVLFSLFSFSLFFFFLSLCVCVCVCLSLSLSIFFSLSLLFSLFSSLLFSSLLSLSLSLSLSNGPLERPSRTALSLSLWNSPLLTFLFSFFFFSSRIQEFLMCELRRSGSPIPSKITFDTSLELMLIRFFSLPFLILSLFIFLNDNFG